MIHRFLTVNTVPWACLMAFVARSAASSRSSASFGVFLQDQEKGIDTMDVILSTIPEIRRRDEYIHIWP